MEIGVAVGFNHWGNARWMSHVGIGIFQSFGLKIKLQIYYFLVLNI